MRKMDVAGWEAFFKEKLSEETTTTLCPHCNNTGICPNLKDGNQKECVVCGAKEREESCGFCSSVTEDEPWEGVVDTLGGFLVAYLDDAKLHGCLQEAVENLKQWHEEEIERLRKESEERFEKDQERAKIERRHRNELTRFDQA